MVKVPILAASAFKTVKVCAPQARENFSTSSAAAERPRLRPAGGRSAGRRAIDLELDAVPVENDA